MSKSAVMQGLDRMQERLKDLDFIAIPAGPFLREWKDDFKRFAIDYAPEWKGGIKDAIRDAQDTKKFPLWARVFSDDPVARWSNFGTGILSEDPDSAHEPYFPPPDRLEPWANDYGVDPYVMALGIHQRGGTKPTRFFQRAADSANASMDRRLGKFGGDIERQAGQK